MRKLHGWGRCSLREYSADFINDRVSLLLANRQALLASCPFSPMELYELTLSREQLDWIARAKSFGLGAMLYHSPRIIIPWQPARPPNQHRGSLMQPAAPICEGGPSVTHLKVTLPKAMPWFQGNAHGVLYGIAVTEFPSEACQTLLDWGMRWARMEQEQAIIKDTVRKLSVDCNTFGQILRIWPALEGFLPPQALSKVKGQKIKSKLPAGVFDTEGKLLRMYQRDVLDLYEMAISEALILPCESDTYPNFNVVIE